MAAEPPNESPVTRLLVAARAGDAAARDGLIAALYGELRSIARCHMRHERAGHTLEPTGLVHEVALRLLGRSALPLDDRQHFLRAASLAMRRVLVDHARARGAAKRDGGVRVTLGDAADARVEPAVDALALDRALERLAAAEPRWAQVVELRFLLGLDVEETAEALGVSAPTVKRDWRFARAWLARELGGADGATEAADD
jgi:RNA polymerase sigma factor (TIGR02999 family)